MLICPLFGKSCKLDASIRSVDLDGQERRFLPAVSCYAAYGIEAVHASVGHDRELKKNSNKVFRSLWQSPSKRSVNTLSMSAPLVDSQDDCRQGRRRRRRRRMGGRLFRERHAWRGCEQCHRRRRRRRRRRCWRWRQRYFPLTRMAFSAPLSRSPACMNRTE